MRSMGALEEHGNRALVKYDEEFKSITEGANTIVWCEVNDQLDGKGGFIAKMWILPMLSLPIVLIHQVLDRGLLVQNTQKSFGD